MAEDQDIAVEDASPEQLGEYLCNVLFATHAETLDGIRNAVTALGGRPSERLAENLLLVFLVQAYEMILQMLGTDGDAWRKTTDCLSAMAVERLIAEQYPRSHVTPEEIHRRGADIIRGYRKAFRKPGAKPADKEAFLQTCLTAAGRFPDRDAALSLGDMIESVRGTMFLSFRQVSDGTDG